MVRDERLQRRARVRLRAGVEARLGVAKVGLRARIGGRGRRARGRRRGRHGGGRQRAARLGRHRRRQRLARTERPGQVRPRLRRRAGGERSKGTRRDEGGFAAAVPSRSGPLPRSEMKSPSLTIPPLLRPNPVVSRFCFFGSPLFSIFSIVRRRARTVLRAKLETPSAASPPGDTQRWASASAPGAARGGRRDVDAKQLGGDVPMREHVADGAPVGDRGDAHAGRLGELRARRRGARARRDRSPRAAPRSPPAAPCRA